MLYPSNSSERLVHIADDIPLVKDICGADGNVVDNFRVDESIYRYRIVLWATIDNVLIGAAICFVCKTST